MVGGVLLGNGGRVREATRRGSEPRDELGGLVLTVVQAAGAARGEHPNGITPVAGIEISQALGELSLESAEALDLQTRLVELGDVRVAHEPHGRGRRGLSLPLPRDRLDVRQRETELLELADPPDADERVRSEQSVTPLGPSVRNEQAELFIQVDGPDGLLRGLRQISHLQQIVVARLGGVFAQPANSTRSRSGRGGRLGHGNQRQVSGGEAHSGGRRQGDSVLIRTLT